MTLRRDAHLLMSAAAFAVTACLLGCNAEGPAERAGETIDEAADDLGDAAEEAGDEIEDAVDDIDDDLDNR